MKIVAILDFDGTIVYEDVFERLLDEYTKEDWRYYDRLVEKGELKLEEAVERQFEMIKHVGIEELLEKAKKYLEARKGFKEFVDFCLKKGIDILIASAGLDFYIKYFLEKNEIKAKCFCVNVLKENGSLKLKFPSFEDSSNNFKESLVKKMKKEGAYTIYVGDGFNDFWAASIADKAVAIKGSVLEEKFKEKNLDYIAISSFDELKAYLETLFINR